MGPASCCGMYIKIVLCVSLTFHMTLCLSLHDRSSGLYCLFLYQLCVLQNFHKCTHPYHQTFSLTLTLTYKWAFQHQLWDNCVYKNHSLFKKLFSPLYFCLHCILIDLFCQTYHTFVCCANFNTGITLIWCSKQCK